MMNIAQEQCRYRAKSMDVRFRLTRTFGNTDYTVEVSDTSEGSIFLG